MNKKIASNKKEHQGMIHTTKKTKWRCDEKWPPFSMTLESTIWKQDGDKSRTLSRKDTESVKTSEQSVSGTSTRQHKRPLGDRGMPGEALHGRQHNRPLGDREMPGEALRGGKVEAQLGRPARISMAKGQDS